MNNEILMEQKISYLEDTLNTLNDVVVKQQLRIDRLEERQNQLIDKLKEMKEVLGDGIKGSEKPPHY